MGSWIWGLGSALRILNDDRLRQSVMASEEGTSPIYTSTYLEAIQDGSTLEICVKEPTSDVMSWMDLSDEVMNTIRISCPAYLRNQPLNVFSPADHRMMPTTTLHVC